MTPRMYTSPSRWLMAIITHILVPPPLHCSALYPSERQLAARSGPGVDHPGRSCSQDRVRTNGPLRMANSFICSRCKKPGILFGTKRGEVFPHIILTLTHLSALRLRVSFKTQNCWPPSFGNRIPHRPLSPLTSLMCVGLCYKCLQYFHLSLKGPRFLNIFATNEIFLELVKDGNSFH